MLLRFRALEKVPRPDIFQLEFKMLLSVIESLGGQT